MPLFPLYERQIDDVLTRINEAMRVFSETRPDLLNENMKNPPVLVSPNLSPESKEIPILAVDGGSRATHFKWISASFAHAVATCGSLNNPGKWTLPDVKDQISALTIYKQSIRKINDYIRCSIEFQTAVAAAQKYIDKKPLLLLDGSIANMYRSIARSPSQKSFFVNKKRIIDGKWMKTKIQKLLEKGVKIVAISKDSRVRHLPTVERAARENFQGKIVIADPIEFADEDIIDRDVVTAPPYVWLLLVRFTDNGRAYRVEIPIKDESMRNPLEFAEIFSLIQASVEVNEPRMMPIRRLGYPYPLACVDALTRVTMSDSEWIHHEILNIVNKHYPYLTDFFGPEVGEAVHTR